MAAFKDYKDRNWVIEFTVLDMKNLRENRSPPIKLTEATELASFFEDESNIYEVLWMLCEKQHPEVDAKEFAIAFTKSFQAATSAFVEALNVFFLSLGRTDLHGLIERTLNSSKKLRANAAKNLSSDLMAQAVEKLIEVEDEKTQDRLKRMAETGSLSGD